MLARMQRKRISFAMLMGMQTGAATLENNMEVPQKWKIELPYNPAIVLLGIYPKDKKILIRRGHMYPNVYSSTSTIAELWKEPKCPLADEWIKKKWYIYYSAIKKNEILPFATTWIELEGIMLSEISQRRQKSYDFTHMRTFRDKTDEQDRKSVV